MRWAWEIKEGMGEGSGMDLEGSKVATDTPKAAPWGLRELENFSHLSRLQRKMPFFLLASRGCDYRNLVSSHVVLSDMSGSCSGQRKGRHFLNVDDNVAI